MNREVVRKVIYISGAGLLVAGASTGIANAVMGPSGITTVEAATRAGLADISILEDASLVSTNGTDLVANADGNFDVSLQFSGTGLASVGLADQKVLVYALPAELQGKVIDGATVDIEANLLPITPGDVPGVNLLFSAVETAVDVFAAAVALTGTDISGVHDAIEDLKGLKDLGSYTVTLPATVSDNGEALYVDFTQGLGTYVNQAYATLFQGLETAVNGIDSSIPLVEAALTVFKQATDPLFDLIYSIGNATSDVLNSSLNGNLLGNMTGTLNMTVTQPETPQATVRAAAVDNALISSDIVSLVQTGGEAVTLNFPVAESTNPLEDYTVPTATLDPISHGDTTISGSIDFDGTEPEGTTFETVVTLPNGDQVRTPIDADGQFTVDTGSLNEGETLTVHVVATNGEHSASSEPVSVTVTAAEEPNVPDEDDETTNPLEDYIVPTATLDPISHGDTSISGSIVLDGTEPNGTSFETVVTLPNGDQVRTPIDEDSQFTVDTGNLNEGDTITVQVVATNGEHSASSEPVSLTVLPAIVEPDFPDDNEDLNPDESNPDPSNPDVSEDNQQNGDNGSDGAIILPDPIEVIDPDETVQISDVETTTTNPLEGSTIPTPDLDPVVHGDTNITGTVSSDGTTPADTTFETEVTLPSGKKVTESVDGQGRFVLQTGKLHAGDRLTLQVVARHGQHRKYSARKTIVVTDKMAVTKKLPQTGEKTTTGLLTAAGVVLIALVAGIWKLRRD